MGFWESPWQTVYVGVFWWWNHQNTPTSAPYPGNSQRAKFILIQTTANVSYNRYKFHFHLHILTAKKHMVEREILQIYALGDLRILRGGKPVRALRSRKAQAMMVYLTASPKSHAREVLADIFWSESSLSQAMSNLRDVIYHLRKHLKPFVDIKRYSITLNPEAAIWMDLVELEAAIAAIQEEGDAISVETAHIFEEALKLYQKDFLDGFYVRGARGFEEWMIGERERIRLATLDALISLVNFHQNEANYQKGIHYARHALELEPLMELGHQHLMRMLAYSGRSSEALIQYETCQQLLLKELGVAPSEGTKEIYERLLKGEKLPGTPDRFIRHNLPLPFPRLIGRDEELVKIAGLLEDPACRLLTLIGVGGIGKTRLGLHAAAAALDNYLDGVWLVELAAITDVEIFPGYIASVFGVTAQEASKDRGVTDVLVNYLRDKSVLLVLDNCEHLVEDCARFAERLLKGCPKMKLLVTSRDVLGIPGERTFQVSPLALPPDETRLQDLEKYPAINLFLERAAASRPRFWLTEENGVILAEICRQLDGIPLAIELAAARVKVISLDQIAVRLQDRFLFLTGGPRTALPRHQTLQATMDWSYSLLTEPERALLRRISVFSGGWTLVAAEKVTSFGKVTKHHVLDLITQLVDKSLVEVDERGRIVRYGMLETVRQYGERKLFEDGEVEVTRRRHASFFVQLAEDADPGLRDSRQLESLALLDTEYDNIRSALGWLLDNSIAGLAFRLVGAMGWFWFMRGHWKEARQWLAKALDLNTEVKQTLLAKAIYRAGGLELIRGNLSKTIELVEDALVICREEGDEEGIAWCLNLLGQACTWNHKVIGEAVPLLSESIKIFNSIDDNWGAAWSQRYLGQVAEIQGDYKGGIRLQKKGLAGFEEIRDIWNASHSLYLLGLSAYRHSDFQLARWGYKECLAMCGLVEDKVMEAHALRGLAQLALYGDDLKLAESLFREAHEELQKIGDEYCAARATRELAEVVRRRGDFEQARQLLDQSLRIFKKLGMEDKMAWVIVRYAALAESKGDGERAARLLGAADVHLGGSKNLPPTNKVEHEKIVSSTRKLLRDQAYDKLFAEGAAMSLQEVFNYSLEGSPTN
jgi:predicted ATPase/DNA-binding SARP family transcriptional activator